jgi:hypothetical protein
MDGSFDRHYGKLAVTKFYFTQAKGFFHSDLV